MAKVIYFDTNLDGKVFDVLKENDNGTVDIGTGETVAVGGCGLVTEPKHGYAIRCLVPVAVKADELKPGDGSPKADEPKATEASDPKTERAKLAK